MPMTPAIGERMLASLVNVSREFAARVAAGLGIARPKPRPTVLTHPAYPGVAAMAALSLTA
jgi:catalase